MASAASSVLGLLSGAASALIWGGGDFAGGMAARRLGQFQVLALTAPTGLAAMILLVILTGESFPALREWPYAMLAGAFGALGIAVFYKGIAMRGAAIVASTSGVVGTALPVVFSALTLGLPGALQVAGIVLGAVGILFVSRSPAEGEVRVWDGLWPGILSGLAFGSFFVLIAQVHSEGLFAPLTISKSTACLVALLMLVKLRQQPASPLRNPLALLAGLMDAGGNVFYLLAARLARIDIAAVLSSMAPAFTVILAAWLVHERISRSQWLGVGLCVLAIPLMAA